MVVRFGHQMGTVEPLGLFQPLLLMGGDGGFQAAPAGLGGTEGRFGHGENPMAASRDTIGG